MKNEPKEHLDFVNELNNLGVSIRSTNVIDKERKYDIYGIFGNTNTIIAQNFELKWLTRDDRDPFKELVKKAIDMDSWKHSWHNEVAPENYDKFCGIIQQKIIDRASEIETLLSVYFQIRYEINNQSK